MVERNNINFNSVDGRVSQKIPTGALDENILFQFFLIPYISILIWHLLHQFSDNGLHNTSSLHNLKKYTVYTKYKTEIDRMGLSKHI